jgi:hypothetical protein
MTYDLYSEAPPQTPLHVIVSGCEGVRYLCSEALRPSLRNSQGPHHTFCSDGCTRLGPGSHARSRDTGSSCGAYLKQGQRYG